MANVIKIKTDIDTSGATAQLTSLENRIVKTADKVATLKSKMQVAGQMNMPTSELKEIDAQIQKAETDLARLNDRMEKFVSTGGKENTKVFKGMQYEAEQLENTLVYARSEKEALLASGNAYIDPQSTEAYGKMANDLKYAENELKQLNQKHDELVEKQNKAASNGRKAYGSLGGAIEKVTKRIWKLMLRVFIFSQITKAFRAMVTAMKEGFQNLAQYSEEYNQNMSNLASVNAELKNNLAAAFEPIMNMIVPALVTLVGWLNTAITTISKFFAALGGSKVYTKATKQTIGYADSLKKANSAQKGVLASFDDLNVLNQNQGSDAGGSGELSGADAFEKDTMSDEFYERVQKIKDILTQMLPLIILIGAALLAWKISNFLTSLMAANPVLATILAILLIIVGLALSVYSYFKMWNEGVDWKGIIGYVAGIAIVVGALMALGQPILAGIVLIVAAIAGLVLAIKDMIENGVTAQNLGLAIISIIALIIGAFILFGSTVLGIIAVIALVVTTLGLIVTYGGRGEEALTHLKNAFKALGDFVSKVFTGDMEGAFESLKEAGREFGNFFISVAEGIALAFVNMVNAIVDAINSLSIDIPEWVPVFGGKSWSPSLSHWEPNITIPRLANGGITTGSTLANIGEAGREAILPLENNTGWMDDLANKLASKIPEYSNNGTAVLEIDGQTAGRIIYPLVQNEASRIGASMATR